MCPLGMRGNLIICVLTASEHALDNNRYNRWTGEGEGDREVEKEQGRGRGRKERGLERRIGEGG